MNDKDLACYIDAHEEFKDRFEFTSEKYFSQSLTENSVQYEFEYSTGHSRSLYFFLKEPLERSSLQKVDIFDGFNFVCISHCENLEFPQFEDPRLLPQLSVESLLLETKIRSFYLRPFLAIFRSLKSLEIEIDDEGKIMTTLPPFDDLAPL